MGIYIKGIAMPEKGTQRVIYMTIDSAGLVELLDPDTNTLIEEYYAVPVPPHGRLIDADEIIEKIKTEGRNQAEYYADRHDRAVRAFGDCFGLVKSAPTVIPADEEKEKKYVE